MAGEISTGGPQWLAPQPSHTPRPATRNIPMESCHPSGQSLSPSDAALLQGYYNGTLESINRIRYPGSLPDLHRLAASHKETGARASSTYGGNQEIHGPSTPDERRTMEASRSGKDPDAVVKNMQNIVNRTKGSFTGDYIAQYKKAHGGKEPPAAEVNREYNEALLKAYTHTHYGFDKLAGIDPEKVHSAFRDSKVTDMFNSFPGSMDVTGADGRTVKGVNINHLLSGVQWNATSSDSAGTFLQKRTVGYGVNSHLAEALKPTGLYGDVHKKGEEPGHSGIFAADSKAMQEAFLNDPVQGMRKFLQSPGSYIADGAGLDA
jgi:hypothetical protein